MGLRGLSKEELPRIKSLIKKTYLLLPLIILIYLVASNTYTMQTAATIAIAAAIAVSMFDKNNRMSFTKLIDALEAGGRSTISVAAACGIAGIIAGTITMTGLASILINGIIAVAGNTTIIALFLTMLCCIVLGMGVPTTANYCIMAATCAPILVTMGIPKIAAHMFVFYFGIVADITPPVALAAYAGSAIAGSNPMKTAINATKLAIGAFIVPYVFALSPELLFIGDVHPLKIVWICITSLIGIFGVAAGLEGYVLKHMNVLQRIMIAAGGLLLIYPTVLTDIIGIGLVTLSLVWQYVQRKKLSATA